MRATTLDIGFVPLVDAAPLIVAMVFGLGGGSAVLDAVSVPSVNGPSSASAPPSP